MRSSLYILLGVLVFALMTGCGKQKAPDIKEGQISVFTSIPPTAFLVEKIGGDKVHTNVLISGSQDPHTFEPTPSQMTALSKADIYVTVGLPFEDVLTKKLADNFKTSLKIVHSESTIDVDSSAKNCNEAACDHCQVNDHQNIDPHIWLAPALLIEQATIIKDALVQIDPENATFYDKNLTALDDEIRNLDHQLAEVLAPYKGMAFYVFHPAFGHFAKAYNLIQKPVEIGGKSPSPKQLADLITKAKADSVHIIFVQPQFDPTAAGKIAEAINGVVIQLDPMKKDVTGNLTELAHQISNALANQVKSETSNEY